MPEVIRKPRRKARMRETTDMTTPDPPTSPAPAPTPAPVLTVHCAVPLTPEQLAAFGDEPVQCSTRNQRKVRCSYEATELWIFAKDDGEGGKSADDLVRLGACPTHAKALADFMRKQGVTVEAAH